jgi:hypothetical protein
VALVIRSAVAVRIMVRTSTLPHPRERMTAKEMRDVDYESSSTNTWLIINAAKTSMLLYLYGGVGE